MEESAKKQGPSADDIDACEPAAGSGNAETEGGRFPIVGIGASAGGLAAFEAFFSGMPADRDPGMAFVLVQHLAPDHKSILSELIRRYTRMEVFEVEDGVVVEPNCAYIIPPNRDMAFLNGTLQLKEPAAPRGQRLPIDFFFRSLAKDQHERAICIVLSGTGSDGTQGVRAIKGEGGMAMAQLPETTEFDGMPRSAIATDLVDYQLPPAEMPGQLIAYVDHAFGKHALPKLASAPEAEGAMNKIFVLLRAQVGHDFSQYKQNTIRRRVERRMAVKQVETIEEYLGLLQRTRGEVEALFRDLLIGVTHFFRDAEAFSSLESEVIPRLFANKPANATIRVWVPGCSTGEEAYSIAILIQERLEYLRQGFKAQVFATDIDAAAISVARTGLYPDSIASDVSPERLSRFFALEPGGSAYRIDKGIRDMLIFSEQDVIMDPPFSKMDLISCRNLLIYLSGELQKKIIPLFHYSLNAGGTLFLGSSESVGEFGDIFKVLDRKSKLYERIEHALGVQYALSSRYVPLPTVYERVPLAAKTGVGTGQPSLRSVTERALLEQVAPAAALVSRQGDILYLHGRTGMYLEPTPGDVGALNILKMAREGLRAVLTVALRKVAVRGETFRKAGVQVKTNGDFTAVDLCVEAIPPGNAGGPELPLYLVVLQDALQPECKSVENEVSPEESAEIGHVAQVTALKQELRAKDEYIQTTIEELETANEEMKSSNEEMQSINEELQSTNEELETAKEELQSVNEELATVNAELQTKLADFARANNDMNNLLAGTNIATVFVDMNLCILRFTPTATEVINLIAGDVGRPVGHIASNLVDYTRLVEDTRDVLKSLIPKEREIQSRKGTWFRMIIQPYRTLSNVIEGAVLTFIDTSEAKAARQKLQAAHDNIRTLHGILPICSSCKKIRDDKGCWNQVEVYVRNHTGAEFSHGICPECAKRLYPDYGEGGEKPTQ